MSAVLDFIGRAAAVTLLLGCTDGAHRMSSGDPARYATWESRLKPLRDDQLRAAIVGRGFSAVMDGYRFRSDGEVLYANDTMDSIGRYSLDGDRILMAFPHGSEGSPQASAFRLPGGGIVMVVDARCFWPLGNDGRLKSKKHVRCNELVPPVRIN